MGVGDDQLHAFQAAPDQGFEKARPERFGLRRTDLEADDLTSAVGVDGHGDYGRHRHDPPAFPLLEIGGVEPEIGPITLQRAFQEGADPLVDLLAELGNLRLRDAREAHRLHQVIDPPSRDTADPGLLDHGDQRLLGHSPRLQKGREVGALGKRPAKAAWAVGRWPGILARLA